MCVASPVAIFPVSCEVRMEAVSHGLRVLNVPFEEEGFHQLPT
jgi:hypothetical protein